MANTTQSGAFKGLKTPRDLLNFNLMRGVTDFSNLEQWDLYEKGYPFLCVLSIPTFLKELAKRDKKIETIVNNYVHVLENDFKGIDNIDNITGETNGEITNGIRSIQLINKVQKPTNSNFSLQYYERSGSLMTKANELYLTGIKDPDTQVKTYHGLIDAYRFNGDTDTDAGKDPGPHQEVFSFLYFLTDNTMTQVERAFLIAAAQPNIANFSDLYTGQKGDISFVEISLSFNGFFISNDYVYEKAQDMLLAMRNPNNYTDSRIIVDSNNFRYKAIAEAGIKAGDNNDDPFATPHYMSATKDFVDPQKRDTMSNVITESPYINHNPGTTVASGNDSAYYGSIVNTTGRNEHILDINPPESSN